MKRIIWAIAAAAVFMTGCENKPTRVWMTHEEYNLILGADCLRVPSGYDFKIPTSIEDAKTKLQKNKEWAKEQKSESFKVPAVTALNTSAVEFIESDSKIYSLYLKTPIEQWASSEEIQKVLKGREDQESWLRGEWLEACKRKE